MQHVVRNLETRRAQIGATVVQFESACGMKRQQYHRIIKNPNTSSVRSMMRIAMLLYCPVDVLFSRDTSECVRYKTPPADYLSIIERNKERLGFMGGTPVHFETYLRIIASETKYPVSSSQASESRDRQEEPA